MSTYTHVTGIADNLKRDFKELSDFEALQIASKIEFSDIVSTAFGTEPYMQQEFNADEPYLHKIAKLLKELSDKTN